MFSRIKQKLSKNCHPYNTRIRSGYISYERQLEWWDEQNQPTYDNVKTKRLEKSTGTPFKRCSSSQPRSRPGLRFRLTPLLLLIERVWWISHSLITSSGLDNTWQKQISHTCGRSCRPARYLSSSTHSHISELCHATALRVSSTITTGHYVLNKDVNPKRLGSENNAMKDCFQYQYVTLARTPIHPFSCYPE